MNKNDVTDTKKQSQSSSRFSRIFSLSKPTPEPPKKMITEREKVKAEIKKYEYNILNKFETSSNFKHRVEKALDSMNQFNNKYALIDGKMVADLYKDYVRMNEEFQKQEGRVKELRSLREEKKTLTEQFQKLQQEHETACKSYELRIQQLKPAMPVEESIARALEQANRLFEHEKSLLTLELSSTKSQLSELREAFDMKNTQNAALKERLEMVCIELAKYKRVVDTNMSERDDNAALVLPKRVDLSFLFSTTCGSKICEFLDVDQILQLRLTNKFIAMAIKNRGEYALVMAKAERKEWLANKIAYMRDVELYKKRVDEIDEDYSKHCFTKYVWLKERAADYMPAILTTAKALFEVENNDSEIKKTPAPLPVEEKKTEPEEGMWSMMKSKLNSINLSGLLDKKEEKQPMVTQAPIIDVFENNPRCVFIRTDAYKDKAEAKKAFFDAVKQAADEYYNNLSKTISNYTEKGGKEFLCQTLSQLMANSRVLLQETKELETLKDILLQKLEEQKEIFRRAEEDFEFMKKKLNAERSTVRELMQKTKSLEELRRANEETIENLNHNASEVEAEYEELLTKQQNTETKLVILAKEVKAMRTKSKDLEEYYKDVQSGMAVAKQVFDELKL